MKNTVSVPLLYMVLGTVSVGFLQAQEPTVDWVKKIGGLKNQEGYSLQQTQDGGYIISGWTLSFDDTIHGDVYLIKTDSLGNLIWQQTFGGNGLDRGYSVQQTEDHGYIISGLTTFSFNDTTCDDVYLIKTNSLGNLQWQKTFGGIDNDCGACVLQTPDRGYIIAGIKGDMRACLIKTDSLGNLQWEKTIGGVGENTAHSIQQTQDKGYILTGFTEDFRPEGSDVSLIKTDSLGNLQWQKAYGRTGYSYPCTGNPYNHGNSVQETQDGGYIITGSTYFSDSLSIDVYLIKTDSLGNLQWQKNFGGTKEDEGYSVKQTNDGGYIIAGLTRSFGSGGSDVYIIKTDSLGNPQWKKTLGGAGQDEGFSVQQTQDGGYIIVGDYDDTADDCSYVYLIKIHSEQ